MQRAFSLIELSIVLVIVGLLVGGALVGQNLIRAAELRSVPTDFSAYQSAATTFRERYFALPGDMANATSFWGTATCPGDLAAARSTQATCNGNGDGIILEGHVAGTSTSNEAFNFWQHLANADLISGRYSGVPDFTGTTNVNIVRRGWNAPASKILGTAAWSVKAVGLQQIASTTYVEGAYGNALELGASLGGNGLYSPVLRPEDALNIDTKMDDAKAGSGTLVVREHAATCYLLADGSTGTTSAAAARADIQYRATSTLIACPMVFRNAF